MHKQTNVTIKGNVIASFLAIFIVGLICYSNSFDNSFHFDDHTFIVENPVVRDITDPVRVKKFFSTVHRTRVIGFLSFAANYYIHQVDVFGYHLVNFLIHIVNGFLVWWFVSLLFNTQKLKKLPISMDQEKIALLVALVFIAHPVQTQAVTFIYQRLASLATMFYLGSICLYLKGRLEGKSNKYFVGSGIMAVLGMLTKEIVFTLPIIILLCEHFFFKSDKETNYKKYLPLLFLLIIPLIFMFDFSLVFSSRFLRAEQHEVITSKIYLLTQFSVIVHYIRLLFIPLGQNFDYDFPIAHGLFEDATFYCLLVLIACVLIGVKTYKKHPLISFGIFWFFITLSVESSIIPIRYVIWEHRLYLPMVGFSLVFCLCLYQLLRGSKKYITIGYIIVALLAGLTFLRNEVWQDGITLWSDVVQKSPNKPYGYLALGSAYQKDENYTMAFSNYQRSLQLYNHDQEYKDVELLSEIYNNQGIIFYVNFQDEKALKNIKKSIELRPDFAKAHNNLGKIYFEKEQYREAMEHLKRSIELQPYYPYTFYYLGLSKIATGDKLSAKDDLLKAHYLFQKTKNKEKIVEVRELLKNM